jgi:FlaA1/EpsC-like NDP-sugar epimerase
MKKRLQLFQWFILDSFIIMASYITVFVLLRLLGFERGLTPLLSLFLWILPLKIIIYYGFGLYKLMVRSIGFEDLLKLSSLVFVSNLLLGLLLWVSGLIEIVGPVELFIITLGEWILLGASRSIFRLYPLMISKVPTQSSKKRIMVVGAGLAGEMLVKELNKNPKSTDQPVLFVDDDTNKIGRRLLGLPVVGSTENIEL